MSDETRILDNKRGYLLEDFRYFHIKDHNNTEFEFHYHDFHKIVILLSGKVTYLIEGRAYKLKPWDVLLVSNNEVHKPLIDSTETYERIVLWVNQKFLEKHSDEKCNLLSCFELAALEKMNLIRLQLESLQDMKLALAQLEEAFKNEEFGYNIFRNAIFTQLIVYLNRFYLEGKKSPSIEDIEYDKTINEILTFINANLNGDLSIEMLSSRFFLNKYYLMHKFKAQTGYTLHSYIQQKRLILASTLLKNGKAVTEVYLECGFNDYSNFIRSFKKLYGTSPKKYLKTITELNNTYIQGRYH